MSTTNLNRRLAIICVPEFLFSPKKRTPGVLSVVDRFNLPNLTANAMIKRLRHIIALAGQSEKSLVDIVATRVHAGMSKGLGRSDIGRQVQRDVSKLRPDAIWSLKDCEDAAGQLMNRARVYSTILDLAKSGIEQYEFLATDDERTCQACRALNRRVFSVNAAAAAIARLLEARDIQGAKSVCPQAFIEYYDALGIGQFQALDFVLPPVCGGCRCDVVAAM